MRQITSLHQLPPLDQLIIRSSDFVEKWHFRLLEAKRLNKDSRRSSTSNKKKRRRQKQPSPEPPKKKLLPRREPKKRKERESPKNVRLKER